MFLGVDGIAVGAGLTTHHEVEAHTNFSLLERAQRGLVVADGSKVGDVAFARICALDQISELITDHSADAAQLDSIREAGVAVTIV